MTCYVYLVERYEFIPYDSCVSIIERAYESFDNAIEYVKKRGGTDMTEHSPKGYLTKMDDPETDVFYIEGRWDFECEELSDSLTEVTLSILKMKLRP